MVLPKSATVPIKKAKMSVSECLEKSMPKTAAVKIKRKTQGVNP